MTWLLQRLDPKETPNPVFALQGTLNWMRALAILCDQSSLSNLGLQTFYAQVPRRSPVQTGADTAAYVKLTMALHHLAALTRLAASERGSPQDTIRVGIVAWYYAVYECCGAMLSAASGANPQEHRSTAKQWHEEVVKRDLIPEPFSPRFDTLVQKETDAVLASLLTAPKFSLDKEPTTSEQAAGARLAYLNGTASYERSRAEDKVRSSNAFKRLGVSDFRTKQARHLRDAEFSKGYVNFLIQAFRYRGKANYRDAICFAFIDGYDQRISQMEKDLLLVAQVFWRMASHYVRRRVARDTWAEFEDHIRSDFVPSADLDTVLDD
jgi:hypothetical protein